MNTEEIKHLLEKYYDGTSTNEEDLLLKEFFSKGEVQQEFLYEKEIFRYYADLSDIPQPSAGFEQKILAAVDSVEAKSKLMKRRIIYITLSGIAAGLLILAGSYFFFPGRSEPRDTFSDPELAYLETMKILYNVSQRINNGTQVLEPVSKMQDITEKSIGELNRPVTIIKGKLKNLEKFQKNLQIPDRLINELKRNN